MENLQEHNRVEKETSRSLDQAAKNNKSGARRIILWFLAMLIGGILGYLQVPQINDLFNFIATVFTRLFQFVAVPVIALAVITTLAAVGAKRETGRIFGHAVFYTLTTTVTASVIALALFVFISPDNIATQALTEQVPEKFGTMSYYDHILSVIPNNILQPFVSGNVLSVMLIAAAIGLALAFMPKTKHRDLIVDFVNGLQEVLFTLIRALLAVLPIGIMAFTGQLVSQIEAGIIVGALGQYTTVIIGSNLIQFFIVLPVFLLLRFANPITVFKGMFPALCVALFSKSSAGTLPVTLASAEVNLGLDRRVTRFVLPICTTINMNGCAAFILVTSLFLMQNAGFPITSGTMITWVFISVLAAVGNAGVPMGCYFLTISLMSSMGIPVDIMGIILPIYAVIDMIETCVNVWSDACVATMTHLDLKGKLPPIEENEVAAI